MNGFQMHHVTTCDINTRNTSASVYKHTYFQVSDQVKICMLLIRTTRLIDIYQRFFLIFELMASQLWFFSVNYVYLYVFTLFYTMRD